MNRFPSFAQPRAAVRLLAILFVCVVGLWSAPELFAQTDSASDEPQKSSFLQLLLEGGWAMIPLLICSLAMLALIIFNCLQLTQGKFTPPELRATVLDHMQHCRVRSAIDSASTSPSFLGRMLAMALPQVDATQAETLGREKVEDAMADFTIRENRGYMNMIGYLALIAQASPMLGLLGTVSGMIKAFSKLRYLKSPDASVLAGSISEALITTATGLCIALPSLVAFFFFRNRLNKLVGDAHTSAGEMLDASLAAVHADQQLAKVPEGLAS